MANSEYFWRAEPFPRQRPVSNPDLVSSFAVGPANAQATALLEA
jgi:hypothetical protein